MCSPFPKEVRAITLITINIAQITRIQNNFDPLKFKQHGDAKTLQYLEVRKDLQSSVDLYRTTSTSQIVMFARNLSPDYTLLKVEGAPTNLLFLINRSSQQLKIYKVPYNGTIYTQRDLDLLLSQTVNEFAFKPYYQYFYTEGIIHYLDQGDIIRINLSNGHRFKYDTKGWITQFWMVDGSSIFTKDKLDRVYFIDLSLLNQ